ncbi:Mpo1-like protein [Psychrobacter alimentarius]|uniref:Mpo1-like protein n=1 Tax=Psychrobacter alimentarius TaxID=261164 RepID=UPI003FD52732
MNLNDTALSTETAATQDGDYTNKTDLIKADPSIKQNFYDFYLNEHQNMACRRLHFAGSSFGLLGLAKSVKDRSPTPLLKGIAAGYACAWVGHFFFEKNKPASFKFPLKSFASDFRMYSDVLRGNLSLKDRKYDRARKKPAQ